MLPAEDILAIPLWINGRAYLTVTPAFQDVRDPENGKVLRRIPLCGANEVRIALESAQEVNAPWAALAIPTRAEILNSVGEALEEYAAHFAGMIAEETGKPQEAADAEVDAAVALLRGVREVSSAGVVAVIGEKKDPLLGALRLAVPAWLAGASIVLRPPPSAPSALFALAELAGRCGFPGGVLNILYGNEDVVEELRLKEIRLLFA